MKISKTNSVNRRIIELYNTSVPLPFKLEDVIVTKTFNDSSVLEESIHNIIDTINPELRKNTEANKREFFKMTPKQDRQVFKLMIKIIGIQFNDLTNNQMNEYFS